ncbi:MAG: hypothetical protein HPY44_17630 [Armatimonadetes bacterium]|nr:hypothetical protein [Armatimonadota bacterium]
MPSSSGVFTIDRVAKQEIRNFLSSQIVSTRSVVSARFSTSCESPRDKASAGLTPDGGTSLGVALQSFCA